MKKLFLILFLFSPMFLQAQIDDLLKKTALPDLLEEKNITTSIDDAYPVAFWLDDFANSRKPVEQDSFILTPGYYKFFIQSYCLKAATNGPTQGTGYLLAPIKGKRDDLVINILKRSAEHPDIKQQDIQLLLWSVIYGAKFTELEPGLQLRVKPLLTDAEIAELSIGIKDIPYDLLPNDIKETAKFYKKLRGKLTDPASNFEEIESMAVLQGDPPSNLLVKNITPGNWSYAGNGFYMRIMPQHYTKSVLELYRPGLVNTTRDSLTRITSFEANGYRTELSYEDSLGSDVFFAEGKYYPIYRFKSIRFTGPNPGEEDSLVNKGWMIRGDGKELKNVTVYKNFAHDPTLAEYKERLLAANEFFKKSDRYRKHPNKPGKGSENYQLGDFNASKHLSDGMIAASNPTDMGGKAAWIGNNTNNTNNWFNCAGIVLSGGSCDDSNNPKNFNPESFSGAPGNTGRQRIGPSKRKAE